MTETESSGNEGLEDFWRPFITPSSPVNELVKEDEGSVQPSKNTLEISNGGEEGSDEGSLKTSNSSEKPLKPVKSNKWKPEEMKRLIKLRGQLHARFQVPKGRMALWEEISRSMLGDGMNRSPGQCKSLWASLVQKYEVRSLFLLPNAPSYLSSMHDGSNRFCNSYSCKRNCIDNFLCTAG